MSAAPSTMEVLDEAIAGLDRVQETITELLSAIGEPRKDLRALGAIQHMVGDIDVRTAAQLALTWLEANAPAWSATLEIAALRAALRVKP